MNKPNADAIERHRVLSRHEAAQLLGVSLPTLDRLVDRGEITPPLHLSARRGGWQIGVLVEWLQSRQEPTAA
jgi:predicted DNA-binding transcriptional regulator AlpA